MTQAPATVRPVTEADLDQLRAMSTRPELGLVDRSHEAQIRGEAVYAVAERDGAVLGSGVLDLTESAEQPEVKLLFVEPGHRREGLGKALSEFLEAQAREQGFTECFLAVDPNNEKMVPMAIDLGYSATGDHRFVEDPDADQVNHPSLASSYYAIYRKSLTMR
ncbi:GNAT family N-acetyltransferase [Aestuariimicrobium ganziense]|uniref:GNAT family N-acetyltransferase n=1 Tax=Aestuariimicrobium ganziense TaxID=2773677 RepID=UPI001943E445|nr:GNAT family N-acetyltransferase [Aestuariimicrobium ganziense]